MKRQYYGAIKETYASRLNKRMKAKRQSQSQSQPVATAQAAPVEIVAREDSHPARYPTHADPDKGQVYGGICNTTLCDRGRAVFFNQVTFGLYCPTCGRGQNGFDPVPISVIVQEKPSIERMNEMHKAFYARLNEDRKKASAQSA